MNVGRTVFAQLLDHLPSYEFQKCVTRYRGDYQQKTFCCWDQYLAMAFAQLETAKTTYHRFGQYSRALDHIRLRLEHRAVERGELERMCSELRLPGDFDVAHISWRPDYDPFFYRQLSRRARRIYLFRNEFIFDVEKAVVVETPQLGHATYVFAKPRSMDSFLALYTKITKEHIRRKRDNAAERLGFLGRVIHGTNTGAWLKEVRHRIGENIDFAVALAE